MCLSLHFPEKTRNAFVFCLESTVKQKDASVFFQVRSQRRKYAFVFFWAILFWFQRHIDRCHILWLCKQTLRLSFFPLRFFGAMAKTEPTCLQDLATEMDQAVAEAASSPVFNNFSMDILQTYLPTYNRRKKSYKKS